MSLRCVPSRFGLIRPTVWEEMSFEEFQDGRHLGYRNWTILAILNFYNAPMPPIKFRLNLTYGLGGNVVWRTSRWPLWWPSWISEQNNFSNSESLCHCDASHQDLAQSNLQFGRRWRPPWISERNDFSNFESLCDCDASYQVSAQSDFGLGGDAIWRISRWPPSWLSEQNDFSNSASPCCHNASLQVSAQSILWFWRTCRKCEKLTMDDRWMDRQQTMA